MRSLPRVALCALSALALLAGPAAAVLTPQEQLFVDTTTADGARQNLQYYTSLDHMAGTPGDYATAQYTAQQLESFGLTAELLPFQTLVSYPVSRSLSMLQPYRFDAGLSEDIYAQDPSSDDALRNLTFHGYGASGDVTGELVYANYGAASDFEYLKSQGIDITGKVALVRYGMVFRGLKVQNAQEYGAVGCLIYSDPADDGYSQGAVYADGPWRPESSVQRGSVQFLSRCQGDPAFLERDPQACGGYKLHDLIPSIPSLPISYGDALPLLQNMAGAAPPAGWKGGLPVGYALGPGPATVRLQTNNNFTEATLWNVRARINGSHPDPAVAQQQVLLGNHRDAWVRGSTDPNSGTASMLEIARGLGALLKTGWKPDRTIVLLSWDGEEYGLLGSVNYVESNAAELKKFAVAMLNVDMSVTGPYLSVAASPVLASLAFSASMDVLDPATNKTLFDVWASWGSGAQVGVLGSGSDFAGFLHHIGIPSMDLGFKGPYGVYHSVYDSFYWTTHFGDPTFGYHRACAQLWGLMALRLASSRVLPLQASAVSLALPGYVATVQHSAFQVNLPYVDWSPLADAVDAFAAPAAQLECYRIFVAENTSVPQSEVDALNNNLQQLEQHFLLTEADGFEGNGLPGRVWYKHVLQAPGIDTGYSASVFPSLSDAVTAVNASAAAVQVGLVARKLQQIAEVMHGMTPYIAPGCSEWVQQQMDSRVPAQQVADEAIAKAQAKLQATEPQQPQSQPHVQQPAKRASQQIALE